IEQFGDVDLNDESAPQRNDLGFRSADEALGAQPTEGDPMNEDNVEPPPMADPPQTEVSQNYKETAVPIDNSYLPDRSMLLSFKFYRVRSIYLGQEPSCVRVYHHAPVWHLEKEPTIVRGLVMLADGDVPITEGSWSLPKLVEIVKNNLYQDEDIFNSMKKLEVKGSYVTARYMYFFEKDKVNIKWSWGSAVLAHLFHNLGAASQTDMKQFVAYTTLLEVMWDPYRAERRSDHNFNENTFFNGLTSSPDHVEPIYHDKVVRQFARIQPIPKNPKCIEVSRLRTWDREKPKQYKPKYDWVDVFSKGLWKE
ncbi:hypothetical protein GIB67_021647, partial [Kingdonia uniflora]